ncbi:MAG: nitroreductase family protein [Armatimonadota bacterium]
MEFFEAVKNRHSVRSYESRQVESEKLDAILATVNAAPSAGDLQGYEVILVRDPARLKELSIAAYGQPFVAQAPLSLVFCADRLLSASKYGDRGAELYSVQDATVAAAYSQLAATSLGLASVWVGAFDTEKVASVVEAPEQITPIAIICIGYAAEEPSPTPRRSLNDLVRMEQF